MSHTQNIVQMSITDDSGQRRGEIVKCGLLAIALILSTTQYYLSIYNMFCAGVYVSPECEAVSLQQFVLVRLQLAARLRVAALLHFYAGNIAPYHVVSRTQM